MTDNAVTQLEASEEFKVRCQRDGTTRLRQQVLRRARCIWCLRDTADSEVHSEKPVQAQIGDVEEVATQGCCNNLPFLLRWFGWFDGMRSLTRVSCVTAADHLLASMRWAYYKAHIAHLEARVTDLVADRRPGAGQAHKGAT
jgi:hypothetical protein